MFSHLFGIFGKFVSCMLLSSLFSKLNISSVVKTNIGASHLRRHSKIIFKTIIQSLRFFELKSSQYKTSFLMSK